MPAYNEETTINTIINGVLATPYQKEIIIVDDGSTDGTRSKIMKINNPEVKTIFHEKNIGKGGAIVQRPNCRDSAYPRSANF